MLSNTKTSENREQTEAGSFAHVSTNIQDIHVVIDNKRDEIQILVPAGPDVQIPVEKTQKPLFMR